MPAPIHSNAAAATSPRPNAHRLPPWAADLRRFERPSTARAAWQLANSLIPYLGLMALMVVTVRLDLPYWVTLALAVPAAGFMIRVFILFHDCVHGSFVGSVPLRQWLGRILGVLVFTPYGHWGQAHLGHHATSGDLDRRGIGDVPLLTAAEYLALSPRKRRLQRIYRHPLALLGIGPLLVFLVVQRIPPRGETRARRRSVLLTDLAVLGVAVAASLALGFETYLKVQLPVLYLGGLGGVWLFFVQHHFDPSHWVRHGDWEPLAAALQGSSYLKLPKVLQWFSGNIGLHHVHHLRPRVPNYALQRCLDETPELRAVEPLTFRRSLRSFACNVWDERAARFVTFREAERAARLRGVKACAPDASGDGAI